MGLPRHHQHFFKFFEWQRNDTPLSSPTSVASILAAYLVTVTLGTHCVKRPLPLPRVVIAFHNLVLCLGSLVMFIGTAHESFREKTRVNSTEWLFCIQPGTAAEGPLYFWSYIYYLSKYYELLDTVILLWKAKPLSVLHVFHHSVVVVMAYLWVDQVQSLQQIALLTNTFIHVGMYIYYFLTSLGYRPPWKQAVTMGQIIQFIFSFSVSIPFWILHFRGHGCSGFYAMLFNTVFNAALLVLFIQFHRRSYTQKRRQKQT